MARPLDSIVPVPADAGTNIAVPAFYDFADRQSALAALGACRFIDEDFDDSFIREGDPRLRGVLFECDWQGATVWRVNVMLAAPGDKA